MHDLNSLPRARNQVRISTAVPQVTERITISRTRETRTSDRGRSPESWGWEELRDYVVREIETIHGEFPKDPIKIVGIFKGFARRHGEMAGPIAVAAMELHRGRWKGSPISVNRFCAGSDPYFAEPIKASLNH